MENVGKKININNKNYLNVVLTLCYFINGWTALHEL